MAYVKLFLTELCPILKEIQPKFENDIKRNNVAIIVEPRRIEVLEAVIRNTMFCLPYNEWNLHIFHSKENESYIKELLPNWSFKMTNILNNGENITGVQYNELFQKKVFWNSIREENILVFHHDSALFHSHISQYMKYRFIGSPLSNHVTLTPKKFGVNGGLSFRKRSFMLECLNKVSAEDVNEYRERNNKRNLFKCCPCPITEFHKCSLKITVIPEDVYFSHAIEILGYDIPSFETCLKFSSDEFFDEISFGMHGFQYARIPEEHLIKMVKNSMLRNIYFMKK